MFKTKKMRKRISILLFTMLIVLTNISLPTRAANIVTVGKQILYNYHGVRSDGFWYEGEVVDKIYADGEIAFCVQPEQLLVPGSHFTMHDYTHVEKKEMENIAYAGWHLSSQTDEDYVATQFMIWEAMGMEVTNTSFSGYASKKAEITERMKMFYTNPSFNGDNITLKVGESVTLTDSNGIFSKYHFASSSDGITATQNGNSLTLIASDDAPENAQVNYQLVKNGCVGTSIVYASNASQDVVVFKESDPQNIRISIDVQKYGKVRITKTAEDTGKVIQRAGVEYEIYCADDNALVSTITSDEKGIAESGLLLFGDYYYIEKQAPEKYLVDSTPHYFSITHSFQTDEYTDSQISDTPVKGDTTIYKLDKEFEDRAQGEATLEGAIYGLYANEDVKDPSNDGSVIYPKNKEVARKTIVNGEATVTNLPLGKYYWKEIKSSKGYGMDTKIHEVDLRYKDQSTAKVEVDKESYEPVNKQAFQIEKLGSSGTSGELPPLAGAEFTYMLDSYIEKYGSFENAVKVAEANDGRILPSEWGRMVTDDNGYAKSKELPYGNYTVKETIVPKDHDKVDDFTVTVNEDNREPQRLRFFEDKTFSTKLAVVKQDKETGNTIALSDMRFKVKALTKTADFEAGEYVGYWAWNPLPHYVNEWKTSEDGTVMLEMSLKAGTYQIEEIESPYGYMKNHEPLTFTITAGWHQQLGPDEETLITTVEFTDEPVKGQVQIDKEAELFKGYQSEMTEYGELFTPVYEKGLLAGVKFVITAKTDIIGMDGKVWYHAGETVETLTSDGENLTVSSLLPLGSEGNNIYSLQEVETAEGYVVDPTIHDFRFDYVDEETAVIAPTWLNEAGKEIETTSSITVNNEKQTALAITSKVMVASNFDHDDAYKKVMFGVFTNEVERLEADSLVGLSNVDDQGNINVSLSQSGTYYMQEVATDDNYVLDTTKYPFTYEYNGDQVQVISVNNGMIENKLKRATLEIIKYTEDEVFYSKAEQQAIADMGEDMSDFMRDERLADDRNYLAFSEFELATDEAFENIVRTGTTDITGRLVFDDLELGTYYVREKDSAEFYEINDEVFEITLSKEHQFETVEVKNDLMKSYVDVKKVDANDHNKTLANAEFTMYADKDCSKEKFTVLTGEDGIAHFDGLQFGQIVYIKETGAPKGYQLSDEVVKVIIDENWVNGDKETRVIEYADTLLPPHVPLSPNTGSSVNIWKHFGLLGMSAAILAVLVKEEKQEKMN